MLELNKIYCMDCIEGMKQMLDKSVDIIITSPPYNLQKEYEEKLSKHQYMDFIYDVLRECSRVLKTSGRICWNVPNQIRIGCDGELWSPSISTGHIMENCALSFFDMIIWNQGYSDCATAWGSWNSPSAPFIRHQTESILIYYKGVWKKEDKGKTDLNPREFMQLTKGEMWTIKPEKDRTHPAPYPLLIPERLLKLFSYVDDIVLDPFMGSGTTAVACKRLRRRYIGFDVNQSYVEYANKRLKNCPEKLEEKVWFETITKTEVPNSSQG